MRYLILSFCLLIALNLRAQQKYEQLPDAKGKEAVEAIRSVFPKFYREYHRLIETDSLIRTVIFINEPDAGPAFASPQGKITINADFLKRPRKAFDDNRLLVVLFHEIGHLHYYADTPRLKWNSENSEKAAFEYSLLKTREMADKADCSPLQTGLKFMKIRSESKESSDPHVRALKRMVNEKLYADYLKYVNEHCNNAAGSN